MRPSFWSHTYNQENLNFLIGSGASTPAISIAGNIEAELNALLANKNELEANKKCLDFITSISSVHSKKKFGFDIKARKVSKSYEKFLSIVDRILFARKNILLARQANIFTTNYDLFIEYAAKATPGITLNDGFDRSSGIGPDFFFAPERYFDRTYRSGAFYNRQIEIPTINLIKMHGSLSWRRRPDTVAFDLNPIPQPSDDEKKDPNEVSEFLQKHFLILPNLRKFHTTLMERVYYDLLRLFSKVLDQQNVVLFAFGFSFADEHILDITRRALRNPTAHLIIFSYNQLSSAAFQTKFSQQRNVTVISPDPTSVIDFPRLNNFLSSILPA